MKILIAENEFITAERIGRLATSLGHHCEWVCSLQEATDSLLQSPCDLMILSAQMGGRSVGQLIPALRQCQPDLALVVTTARNSLALEQQVRAQGIIYYLIKPLSMDELSSVIRHTSLNKHRFPKERYHEKTNARI